LFGDEYKQRVLELNASDERGIQVVREKIKKYSQRVVQKKNQFTFQIVILDEADSMTVDAQSALRRIIEDNTRTTRFCIICNYVSKIIDPIASRCAKFRFTALPRSEQMDRLKYIADNEKVNINSDIISQLIDISEGDLRRSINLLQSISQLDSSLLSQDIIEDICGTIPETEIKALLDLRYAEPVLIMNECKKFFQKGYDIKQLLIQLNDIIAADQEMSKMDKKFIFELIMDCELKLLQNATPIIQLNDLLLGIRQLYLMD
jgi:replication factor C subunit 2/4